MDPWHPQNEKGTTLIEMVVIILIIGILAAVTYARYQDLTSSTQTVACRANQALLEAACILYYTERAFGPHGSYPSDIDEVIPYLVEEALPVCPGGGTYITSGDGVVRCSLPEHSRLIVSADDEGNDENGSPNNNGKNKGKGKNQGKGKANGKDK